MKPLSDWIEALGHFFRQVQGDLPEVLDAAGCREGWLQGEAFRFFRARGDAFCVNAEPLGRGRKADLAAYAGDEKDSPLWMIGELKLFGVSGYYEKILGVPVAPLAERVERGEKPIVLTPPAEVESWGLMSDYCRLRDFRPGEILPRLLVFVLDTRGEADRLGTVLKAVDFSPPAVLLHETNAFVAKCWPVGRSE